MLYVYLVSDYIVKGVVYIRLTDWLIIPHCRKRNGVKKSAASVTSMHRHRAEAETQIVVGYHSEIFIGAFAFILFVCSHKNDRTGRPI
jgi:hypothetical protein